MKTKTILLVFSISIMLLSSCSQGKRYSGAQTTQFPMPATIQTLESLPTPVNVFEYPDQVTDGKLVLSVAQVENICHKISEPIKFKLTFTNITDKAIKVPDRFLVAVNRRGDGGNVIPLIETSAGADIYSLADFNLVDIFNTPSDSYSSIPANQTADFVIDFRFPDPLARLLPDGTKQLATPDIGQYLIRFVYIEPSREIDTWYGAIGSNRLEFCVLN